MRQTLSSAETQRIYTHTGGVDLYVPCFADVSRTNVDCGSYVDVKFLEYKNSSQRVLLICRAQPYVERKSRTSAESSFSRCGTI